MTVHESAKDQYPYQNWRPIMKKLPPFLKRIIRTGADNGLLVDDVFVPREIRLRMSIWHHVADTDAHRKKNNTRSAKCEDHVPSPNCVCPSCSFDLQILGCANPASCRVAAHHHYVPSPEDVERYLGSGARVFNGWRPRDTYPTEIRIFTNSVCSHNAWPAQRDNPMRRDIRTTVSVYSSGKQMLTLGGDFKHRGSSVITLGNREPIRVSISVTTAQNSSTLGEVRAIQKAVLKLVSWRPILLVVRSKALTSLRPYAPVWEQPSLNIEVTTHGRTCTSL